MLNQGSILYNDCSILLNPVHLYGNFESLEVCQLQEQKIPSIAK